MRTVPLLLALAALMPSTARAAEEVVTKVLDDLEVATWPAGPWNTATIDTSIADEAPADLAKDSAHSMRFQATFAGTGFQHGSADAPRSLAVPGKLRVVRLRWRGESGKYPLMLNFADGWGRGEADGRKHEWNLGDGSKTQWTSAEFRIPAEWKQPVRLVALTTHNYGDQKTAAKASFLIDQIEVETDIAGADPLTGLMPGFVPDPAKKGKDDEFPPKAPLFSADIVGSQPDAEVFTGLKAGYRFTARSWRPGTASGTLAWNLAELADGTTPTPVSKGTQAVSVASVANVPLDIAVTRLGLWKLSATVTWADKSTTDAERIFACLPAQPEVSDAEKDASPWGLNVHGGLVVFPETFRRAGFVWFRDYAFTYDWMERAKGDDKKYAGWPWYPPLMAKYEKAGARVLPVLVGAIKETGTTKGPTREWRRSITDIISAFPSLKAWELDNEFDGLWKEPGITDEKSGWKAMRATHRAFGQVLKAAGGEELLAVQNGEAGINPERVRDLVMKGDFADINVINCHHYCGVDAPETNIANQNTGGEGGSEGGDLGLFHDRLTALVDAAAADGKKRQTWITEFGWDTRIAKVVTPYEQACYLQRGYLLTLHAGLEKAFWYWWADGDKATNFFDGCGLIDYKRQPKLALAAMGAMTALLPSPTVIGTIEAGPGTLGYLMQQGDRRIAALWSIEKDDGPSIEVGSGELRDMVGNPIAGRKATLRRAPLWISGISADDRFTRQAAFDLASPWLVTATAGDPLTVKVRVRGGSGAIALAAPAAWKVGAAQTVDVPAGQERIIELHGTIPANLAPGEHRVPVTVDAKGPLKRMEVRVLVRPALDLRVAHLSGEPGDAIAKVRVTNRSTRPLTGTLRAEVPATWSVAKPTQDLPTVAPGATAEIPLPLRWAAAWNPKEQARITVTGSDGAEVASGIVPGAFTAPKLKALAIDGDLADWPAESRIPDWCIDASQRPSGAELRLGWTPEGLAVGLQVTETTLLVSNPSAFWDCDALEFLVDARDRAKNRPAKGGERMFWFVPQPAQKSVFSGQWKRGDEIAETRNGLPEVRSASRAVGAGYVLEALIPTALIPDVKLSAGTRLSGILLLGIRGKVSHSEVGWPATKGHGTGGGLETWPLIVLGD